MKNWKTTMAGIIAIVGGVVALYFAAKNKKIDEATITASLTSILTGVGLIFAKDFNVSGSSGNKSVAE